MSRISKIALRRVAIPFREPFRISNGEVSLKESIIIELHSPHGIAYGEASPMSGSFYSTETPDSTFLALRNDLVPMLMRDPTVTPDAFADLLDAYGREPFARAGIEGAMWHLESLERGCSIGSIFGASPSAIPSGLAVGMYDSTDDLLRKIEGHLERGYKRVKIKIMPGWDLDPLDEVRDYFGDIELMVDANASYNLRDHAELLQELDEYELMMIEQPLARDAFEDMAELNRSIESPICADESAESMEALEKIIALKSASIINIKVQRVGGLRNAVKMLTRAREAGLECWLGTMPELGIASAQALQIASLPGFVYPTDIEESVRWFEDDIVEPLIAVDDGMIEPRPGIGMGYPVSASRLELYTTEITEYLL